MSERSIKLNIVENSHAFLKEAIANALAANSGDVHRWQFAILHIVQTVELSLKAALHRVHPALVYENLDNARNSNMVSLRLAMQRLADPRIGALTLSARDQKRIESSLEVRNRVTHADFELTPQYAAAKFFELLPFIFNFQQHHLGINLRDIVPENDIRAIMLVKKALEELVQAVRELIREKGIEPNTVWVCPDCEQEAFVTHEGEDACYVCRSTATVIECPHCGEQVFEHDLESFVDTLDTDYSEGQLTIQNSYGFEFHMACPDCIPKIKDDIEEQREADEWDRELDYAERLSRWEDES